jgi:HSP20 family protein
MITRWDPFRDVNSFNNTLNRLFQSNLDVNRGSDELLTSGTFVPAVDIYENEHSITLKLEVPGVNQNDIDVRLENNTLTVRGERKFETEEKEENFHRIERRYGSFSRSFTLPSSVDPEKVKADYKDGVLNIELAKRAEAKPKQIKVSVTGANQKEQPKQVKGTGQAA